MSEETKRVFIAPDRSKEERVERKKLVDFIKEKRKSDPERYYYISAGSVHSQERVQKPSTPAV